MSVGYAIIKTVDGNNELLNFFGEDEFSKEAALSYGKEIAATNEDGYISCVFAAFNMETHTMGATQRVFQTWFPYKKTNEKSVFAIAYFKAVGPYPSITDERLRNLDEARKKADQMKLDGYSRVKCFEVGDDCPEKPTWTYVNNNCVWEA